MFPEIKQKYIIALAYGLMNKGDPWIYPEYGYTTCYDNGDSTTLDLDNCYYLQDILGNCEYINANEGTTALTDTNVQEVLDSLNNYVEEHKNDYYEDYGITLVNWVIGENGYPVLDLKYE